MRTIEIYTCAQKLPSPNIGVWRVTDDDEIFFDHAEIAIIADDEKEFYEADVVSTMQWGSGVDMRYSDSWFVL